MGQIGQSSGGFEQFDVVQLLVLIALLLLMVGIFVFSIVIICLNLSALKRSWRVGLCVSAVLMLIMSASVIATLSVVDMQQQVMSRAGAADIPLPAIYVAIGFFVLVALLIKSSWYVLVFSAGVGEWERAGLPGYALLMRGDAGAWSGVRLGAICGAIAGLVSAVVMIWLEVGTGPLINESMLMFQGVEDMARPMSLLVFSLAVLGPAITEELTFRGLMLGFFFRISGHRRFAVVLSIVVVSLLWSLLHIPNTDMPVVKCLQIFLIGLIFGELARRRGLESAIAGHVMLNLVAVIAGVLWQ